MKPPGSAVKNNGVNRAALAAASAEAAQAVQIGQLKEDLYSDLTGLIIRDVKKRESDHLYDCIQTGVNGSKLFVTGWLWIDCLHVHSTPLQTSSCQRFRW